MILKFPHNSDNKPMNPLGVTSSAELHEQRLDYQLKVLELSSMLQRKKDLRLLLECFYTEVHTWVRFDGLCHVHAKTNLETLVGVKRQYTDFFELRLGDVSLGHIGFYRARDFSPRESRELERQVGHLVYPVREALIHSAKVKKAFTDELTGLQNRVALDRALPREILLAQRNEMPLSVMMVDLDRFSALNEYHGYAIGDEVLRSAAQALQKTVRKSDMIFRFDTDTFVIVLSGTEYSGAKVLAERLRAAMDPKFTYENVQIVVSASAGITQVLETDDAGKVLDRALAALINAKRAGRNTLRAVDDVAKSITLI